MKIGKTIKNCINREEKYMSLVVTIGRQYGSAGKDIGKRIASSFNIPFYDKELVNLAAKKGNLSEEALKKVDEKATNSLLYTLASGNYSMYGMSASMSFEMPINDKLFLMQSEVIKEIALNGDCVIVGRSADYVLEQVKNVNVLSIFVYAPFDYRVKRVQAAYGYPDSKARDIVKKTDKQRRVYYEYYTNKEWGDMGNYDLCLNTKALGINEAADMVVSYIKDRYKR